MNCFHRLVIASFFTGIKEEIYHDMTCYTGVDFENRSTVITGDSLQGNVHIHLDGVHVQEHPDQNDGQRSHV